MPSKTAQRYRRLLTRRLHRRPLLPFLLAATLAVEVVLLVADLNLDRLEQERRLSLFAIFGYRFGVLGSLAIWLVSARRAWFGRLTVAVGIAAWVSLSLVAGGYFGEFQEAATMVGATLLMQTVFCFLVVRLMQRTWGYRLMNERRQFSVGGMLLAMTTLAAAAAASRGIDWRLFTEWHVVFLACCEATFPAMLWWALTRTRNWWLAALVTFPVMLVGYTVAIAIVFGGNPATEWMIYIAAQGAIIVLWVLGLRSRRQPLAPEVEQREELRILASEDYEESAVSSIDLHG